MTRRYFDVVVSRTESSYRKVLRDDRYFGETQDTLDAWVPRGRGECFADGRRFFAGTFGRGGLREGRGKWVFSDQRYSGEFRAGELHGRGLLGGGAGEEPVLMWRGRLMCRRSGADTRPRLWLTSA